MEVGWSLRPTQAMRPRIGGREIAMSIFSVSNKVLKEVETEALGKLYYVVRRFVMADGSHRYEYAITSDIYIYPTYQIILDDVDIPHPPARYIYHLKNPERSKYYKEIIEAFDKVLERELQIEEEIINELEEG